MWLLWVQVAVAANLVVDDPSDVIDAIPGDGVCATVSGRCTLRAALTEAEATDVADVVELPADDYFVGAPLIVTRPVAIVGDGRAKTFLTFGGADVFEASDTVLDLRDLAITGGIAADGCIVGAGTDVFLDRVDLTACTTSGVSLTALQPGDPLGHVFLRDVVLRDHAGVDVVDPPGVVSPALVLDADGVDAEDSGFTLSTDRPWSLAHAHLRYGQGLDVTGAGRGTLDHVAFVKTDRALSIAGAEVHATRAGFLHGGEGAVLLGADAQLWCDTCLFWQNAGGPAIDVPAYATDAVLALNRSLLYGNASPDDGAALRVRGGAGTEVHVRNTTFANNRADGSGGAVAVDSHGATVLLEHVSFGRNLADADDAGGGSGGALWVAAGSDEIPTLAWSAVAENGRGVAARVLDDCDGRLLRGGVNLIGVVDARCVVTGGVDLAGTRAAPRAPLWQVVRLATGLYGPAPKRGSPLLDAAVGSTAQGDMGGRARPLDGDQDNVPVADLGAVEKLGSP